MPRGPIRRRAKAARAKSETDFRGTFSLLSVWLMGRLPGLKVLRFTEMHGGSGLRVALAHQFKDQARKMFRLGQGGLILARERILAHHGRHAAWIEDGDDHLLKLNLIRPALGQCLDPGFGRRVKAPVGAWVMGDA